MVDEQPQPGRRLDVRGQVVGLCVGLASGVGLNLASTGIGWLGVAVAAGIAAIVAATSWLRRQRLPAHAPLARYSIPVLLCLAAGATVASLAVPDGWITPTVLVAAGLVLAAVLIPTDTLVALLLLASVAVVGTGVVGAGLGIRVVAHGHPVPGVAVVVAGVVVAAHGPWAVRGGPRWIGAVDLATGTAVLVTGAALLGGTDRILGAVLVVLGALLLGSGVLVVSRRRVALAAAYGAIGLGIAVLAAGVLAAGDLLLGVAGLVVAASVTANGVAALTGDRGPLVPGIGFLGAGVAIGCAAAGSLTDGPVLLGAVSLGGAVALVAAGLWRLRRQWRRLYRWLTGAASADRDTGPERAADRRSA